MEAYRHYECRARVGKTNEIKGENVSGWVPLLHPEMIIQICTGSGESKQGILWRVFVPVPCPSGNYSGRQLSRGLCQIVSLSSALLLQDAQKDCVACAGYINHTRLLFYSPQPCWDILTRLLMFASGWMFYLVFKLLSSNNCSWHWFCCWQSKGDEQQAEEKSNCRVLFSGSEEVVLLPSCWDKNKRENLTSVSL